MEDIVFVTADSVRYDYMDAMEYLSSTFDIREGMTVAHYTRPSLAGIHSSTFRSVLSGQVANPTLAQELSAVGYDCLGLSPNPNTDATFGFADGFDRYDSFLEPGNRGTSLRQYFARFDTLRKIYYKFYPPQAKSEDRPRDREVIDQAIEWFNDAESPRFLWIHLMETHRPYGTGDDAVSKKLDQKAFFKSHKLTDAERVEIEDKYRDSLARADQNIQHLLKNIDSNPKFVFTADHGEGFGDEGYYYHQPQRRRVDDCLIKVPVIFDGFSVDSETLSHLDLAPTITASAGGEIPEAWLGNNLLETDTEYTITVASWNNQATVLWQDFEHRLVSQDADVVFDAAGDQTVSEETDVPEDIKEQMRDLGYVK